VGYYRACNRVNGWTYIFCNERYDDELGY
jgi:hypothetical protein